MKTKKKILILSCILIGLLLVCPAVYFGILYLTNPQYQYLYEITKEINDPDSVSIKTTMEVEICKVYWVDGEVNALDILHGDEESLYEADSILMKDFTIVRNQNGRLCSRDKLKEGQKIEATVLGEVFYNAVIDPDTGKTYGNDTYFTCFEIKILE